MTHETIADLAGGDWPLTTRAIAEAYEATKQDQSKRTILLSDIRSVFAGEAKCQAYQAERRTVPPFDGRFTSSQR